MPHCFAIYTIRTNKLTFMMNLILESGQMCHHKWHEYSFLLLCKAVGKLPAYCLIHPSTSEKDNSEKLNKSYVADV